MILLMADRDSEQLFLQTAQRLGWPVEDAAIKERLETLYREYMNLWEVQPYHRAYAPSEWNDEDADVEDENCERVELRDWADEELTPEEAAAVEQAKGAAVYYAALQEVAAVAGRILKDLEDTLAKGKSGNAVGEQKILEKLRSVAQLNRNHSPKDAEAALQSLEETAYHSMVGSKGFLGIRNSTMQKVQELAKEGWALAGQAQVDLDLSALPPEDPRCRIDPSLPLCRQMQKGTDNTGLPHSSGRLQRLVRFDDLQKDLRSQNPGRTPKN